jgi:hypothetical protein
MAQGVRILKEKYDGHNKYCILLLAHMRRICSIRADQFSKG